MNNVIQLDVRRAKLDELTNQNIAQGVELCLSAAFTAASMLTGQALPPVRCRISAKEGISEAMAQGFKKHRPEILEGILKALDTPEYRQLWRGSVDEVRQGLRELGEDV